MTLQLQHDLSYRCYKDIDKTMADIEDINVAIVRYGNIKSKSADVDSFISRAKELLTGKEGFAAINGSLGAVFGTLQGVDTAPTSQCIYAANTAHAAFESALEKWELLKKHLYKKG